MKKGFIGERRYSLLLVPDDNGEVRHLRITSTRIRIILICLGLLLACTVFLAVQYFGRVQDAMALARLEEENAYLWSRVSLLDEGILDFQVEMAELVKREKALRIMADLPEIDPDVRRVGVGGHSFENDQGLPQSPGKQMSSPSVALSNVDQLLRQAKLEKQSLQEVEVALGENSKRLEHTPTIWPTTGYVSRGFGSCVDPFTGQLRPHEGLDIVNRVGTPIVATAAGKVIQKGWKGGYGWMVVIDHGYGRQTAYGHLDSIKVNKGERVKRGQVIATLGNSGRSTGPHLHYEVRIDGRPVNPHKYLLPEVVVD